MLALEPRASDDETLESEASIGTADSSENLNVDSEGAASDFSGEYLCSCAQVHFRHPPYSISSPSRARPSAGRLQAQEVRGEEQTRFAEAGRVPGFRRLQFDRLFRVVLLRQPARANPTPQVTFPVQLASVWIGSVQPTRQHGPPRA